MSTGGGRRVTSQSQRSCGTRGSSPYETSRLRCTARSGCATVSAYVLTGLHRHMRGLTVLQFVFQQFTSRLPGNCEQTVLIPAKIVACPPRGARGGSTLSPMNDAPSLAVAPPVTCLRWIRQRVHHCVRSMVREWLRQVRFARAVGAGLAGAITRHPAARYGQLGSIHASAWRGINRSSRHRCAIASRRNTL